MQRKCSLEIVMAKNIHLDQSNTRLLGAILAAIATIALAMYLWASEVRNQTAIEKEKVEITQTDAIRLAEEFIARNGYTDSAGTADESNIAYEMDDPRDVAETLVARSNTLESRAYISHHAAQPPRWTVVFRYNAANVPLRKLIPNFDEHATRWGRARSLWRQTEAIYVWSIKTSR